MPVTPVSDMTTGTSSYGNAFIMLSDRKLPGSQMHMSTLLECTGEVASGGHCRQTPELVACGVTENVSIAQSVQAEACCSEKAPVVQGTQVEGSDAPTAGEAVPAGQGRQSCVPSVVDFCEYVPGWHCCAESWVSTV